MQGPAPFPSPPAPSPAAHTSRRRRALPLWAGILIGVLLTLVLLVGAGGYAIYKFGWGAFADQAVTAMDEQPIIQRCIGKIESSSLDTALTSDDPREDAFAFHIKGPSGKGLVTAVFTTVDADHERIDEGELTLEDGRTFKLRPADAMQESTPAENCPQS